MYKLRPNAFTQKWCHLPFCYGYTVLFILIYLTLVSGGRIQKEYQYEEHERNKLLKTLTGGMSVGDDVDGELASKLYLSKLVVLGQYEKAQSLALIDPEFSPVPSYSGFLCTNSTFNTNLFFWFFPAAYNQDDAPLVLWLNGAGSSSLFSLFAENGPFSVDGKGILNARTYSWTLSHSVLYIDNPAGVGFSFTEDEDGYATTQERIANDLYVFLTQFLLIFPKFRGNDFFLAGQSYAGKMLPSLAMKIHQENERVPAITMNLKGLILFSPYVEPLLQSNYGLFLQTVGLIDSKQKLLFDEMYNTFQKNVENEEWLLAHSVMDETIYGDLTPHPTLFYNITGFRNYLNYMRPTYPATYSNHRSFLRQNHVRTAIHVGTQKYHSFSAKVVRELRKEFHQSGREPVEFLLDAGYKILIVAGQLDIVVHSNGIDNMVHDLNWSGKDDFAAADRSHWLVNNEIAGYIKVARNLAYVTMRNAGHTISHDKPFWSYTLANEFTSGLLLDDRVKETQNTENDNGQKTKSKPKSPDKEKPGQDDQKTPAQDDQNKPTEGDQNKPVQDAQHKPTEDDQNKPSEDVVQDPSP